MTALTSREKEIMRLLAVDGNHSVTDLSKRLGVSTVTIRTDLNSLADKGYMVLKRGSAVPAFHPNILNRQECMVEEKNAIALAAAELINDGDQITLVAGTTTSLVVKYLLGKRDIRLVTNSTLLLPYVRVNPAIHVTMVGGEFRPSIEGMVGPFAVAELKQFHVKTTFLGTDGFSVEKGVTAHLVEDAEIARVAAAQAERVVLLASSDKYGKAGFAQMLPINKINMLITDAGLSEQAKAQLGEAGVEVRIV